MEAWIIWLIVIGVLLIIELLTQFMCALCLAVGGVGGFIASLCGLSIVWQIIVSVAAYIILVPLFQKWHALSVDKKGKEARTGMDALLGRTAVLIQEITPEHPGRARIDGDNWQVITDNTVQVLPRGIEVEVIGYDSIVLRVRPVNSERAPHVS